MKKNILYLDIDGVLNTYEDFLHLLKNDFNDKENYLIYDTGHFACKEKLKILKDFVEKHDMSVVIVSSWMHRLKGSEKVCEFLNLPCFGETESFSGGFLREKRIKQHIKDNKINHYVVIDDAGKKGYKDLENVITVGENKGITRDDLMKADKILATKKRKRKPA